MNKHSTPDNDAQQNPMASIRFKKREIDHILHSTNLGDGHATVGHDSKGYYVERIDPDIADPVGEVVRSLLGRLRAGGQVVVADPRPRAAPRVRARQQPSSPPGVCAQVREWAEAHPQASVQEALAQFPNANPTTVRIQFRKTQG